MILGQVINEKNKQGGISKSLNIRNGKKEEGTQRKVKIQEKKVPNLLYWKGKEIAGVIRAETSKNECRYNKSEINNTKTTEFWLLQ